VFAFAFVWGFERTERAAREVANVVVAVVVVGTKHIDGVANCYASIVNHCHCCYCCCDTAKILQISEQLLPRERRGCCLREEDE